MKLTVFAALLAALLVVLPAPVRAQDDEVSFQVFYDNLANTGTWIQTDDYGYVWQPTVADEDWRPYYNGHWVYTDYGWTWYSDEPWGWATYHYGRWVNLDGYGWCWVPGYQWAPAWVSWRYGGGFAGWAPLPPQEYADDNDDNGGVYQDGYYQPDDGQYHHHHHHYDDDAFSLDFTIGDNVDIDFNIGGGYYNFIPVESFGEDNYRHHYIRPIDNYAVINRTTNITNIRHFNTTNNLYAHSGPSLSQINNHSHTPVRHMNLAAANAPGTALTPNSLVLYQPRVNPKLTVSSKPTVTTVLHKVARNHGDDAAKPLQATHTIPVQAPPLAAIQAANLAKTQAPASSKIVNTAVVHHPPKTSPTSTPQTTAVVPGSTPVFHPSTGTTQTTAVVPGSTPVFHPTTGTEVNTPRVAPPIEPKPSPTHHHSTSPSPGEYYYHPPTQPPVQPKAQSQPQVEQYHPPTQAPYHPPTQPPYHPPAQPQVQQYHPAPPPQPPVQQYHPAPAPPAAPKPQSQGQPHPTGKPNGQTH